jgi:hypothetical protein
MFIVLQLMLFLVLNCMHAYQEDGFRHVHYSTTDAFSLF